MTDRIGSGPIDPKLSAMMNGLAKGIDTILNGTETPGPNGFLLMVFPFEGFAGRCNYISNASRDDVVTLLKEQLSYFQGMPDTHEEGLQ